MKHDNPSPEIISLSPEGGLNDITFKLKLLLGKLFGFSLTPRSQELRLVLAATQCDSEAQQTTQRLLSSGSNSLWPDIVLRPPDVGGVPSPPNSQQSGVNKSVKLDSWSCSQRGKVASGIAHSASCSSCTITLANKALHRPRLWTAVSLATQKLCKPILVNRLRWT